MFTDYKAPTNHDKFVIDHMGRMQTTLSPKELKEVAELESDDYYNEVYSSQDGQEESYQDYQSDQPNLDNPQSDPSQSSKSSSVEFAGGQQDLMSKCTAEGGTCTTFTGCDTVSNIYKGYCNTDYSSVCCVAREVICEKNDGICTDDREACLAAGEIMGKKYNLRFYTWMDCNSTFTCCRPSRKTTLFSTAALKPTASESVSYKPSTNSTPLKHKSTGSKMRSTKRERADASSRNRARQLGTATKRGRKEGIGKSRLSKLSRGSGMKPLPGFPNKEIVSPLFEQYPEEEDKRQFSRNSVKKKSVKRQRRQKRPSRENEFLQELGLPVLHSLMSSYPVPLYSPQADFSRFTYPSITSAIQTGLPSTQQQAAYTPYNTPAVNSMSLTRTLPALQNTLQSAAKPSHSSRTDYLTNYPLSDLSSSYSTSLRHTGLSQANTKTTGHLATPTSLFGNIYLRR